ncbi:carbohydrate ABC transporter permease [Jiangella endophytica]|uniref:carbohydrate ABC transporter permease n=1 Tax=Jiangella endophytica TaxID=1623398 RepID=UPI0018E57319|nr:sugar ABC transporter permease [Jiangella endophytica]
MTARTFRAEGRRAVSSRRPRPGGNGWLGVAFVAPQVLGVIVLGVVPFIFVIWYSFNEWRPLTGEMEFIGLDNYYRLVADPTFSASIIASLLFSAGVLVLNLVIAISLAVLLNRRMKGITGFRTIFFSPVVVSVVAWSVTWGFLLAPDGGINGALAILGIDGPNWLADPSTALISLVVVQVFKGVGMNMVLFLAALQSVPEEIREAAHLDGAGPWRSFRSITVPMIAPTILLTGILTTIGSLEVFAPVQLLTGGGPGDTTNVLPFFLYRTAFISQQFGYASAIGVVLFAIILALTMLQWTTRRRWVHDEV